MVLVNHRNTSYAYIPFFIAHIACINKSIRKHSKRFRNQMTVDTYDSEISPLTASTNGLNTSPLGSSESSRQISVHQPMTWLSQHMKHLPEQKEYESEMSSKSDADEDKWEEEKEEEKFGPTLVLPHIMVNLSPQAQKKYPNDNLSAKSVHNKNIKKSNGGKHIKSVSQIPTTLQSKNLGLPDFLSRSASANKYLSPQFNVGRNSLQVIGGKSADIYCAGNQSPLLDLTEVLNKLANQGLYSRKTAKSVAEIHNLCT